MPAGYELFHATHIQRAARRRVHRLYGVALGLILITVLSFALERLGLLPMAAVAWILAGSWLLGVGITARRLRHVRRTVWCVKVAGDALVGYDHARRKTRLEWTVIHHINLTDEALVVVKSPHCCFRIATTFPEYAALSHRIVQYANRHGITVCIDGRPWHQFDVYALYPFLTTGKPPTGKPPTGASGMTA